MAIMTKQERYELLARRIPQIIAIQVRLMRQERGWTLKETATRADLSWPTICKIEHARMPLSLSTLQKLAAAFEVALIVRFCSWGELVISGLDISVRELCPTPFTKDTEFINK